MRLVFLVYFLPDASAAFGWTNQPSGDSRGSNTQNYDVRGGNQPLPPSNPRGRDQPTFGTRDLLVEVISGTVPRKDTFSTDAYMSVSVCKQKERTPTVKSTLKPTWNWRHQVRLLKI